MTMCLFCGMEILDPRTAFDVVVQTAGTFIAGGEPRLDPAHPDCAVGAGVADRCEGCNGVFAPEKLCGNERTRRRECVECYKAWRLVSG